MKNLFLSLDKKINGFIWTLISTGFFLLFLGILIVWTDFFLRLVMGLIVIVVAYVFFYGAFKLIAFKKEFNKYFKIFK